MSQPHRAIWPPLVETVKSVTFCDKNACFLHGVGKTKTSAHNPFPEFQATLVHLPYGMKLIVNIFVKPTSPIISGHLRAWKKRSRCVKIANSKAGGRMKAWRLALSVIRLLRIEGCPIPAVNITRVYMLERKKQQLFAYAALLR